MNNNYNNGTGMSQVNGNPQSTNNGVNNFINNIPKDKVSLIGYIGALVAIIANFLPFVVIKAQLLGYSASESFTYISTRAGKTVLILTLISLVLIALKKHAYSIITTGIAALQFLYNLANVKKAYANINYSYITVKWGIGIYLTLIGLVALGVSLFLYWKENPTCFQDAINKFKNIKNGNNNQQQPVQQMNTQPIQSQPVESSVSSEVTQSVQSENNIVQDNN